MGIFKNMIIAEHFPKQQVNKPSARSRRQFHYRWQWRLQAAPEALWPLVADTNRFNRDTGVPAVERRDGEPLTNARRRLRLFRLGVPVEWVEEPFEWVRPYRYGVMRHYVSGPVHEMRTLTELKPLPEGGTHVTYEVWVTPRNWLGLLAIPVQIGLLSSRAFARAFRNYDEMTVEETPSAELPGEAEFMPGGQRRMEVLTDKLVAEGAQTDIVNHLKHTIEHTDSLTLARMRPYALADAWGQHRRDVLEHCLLATRRGLLEMEWDVLCPMCRNTKQIGRTLGDIHDQVHCDSCNIDFEVNFERAVELTFHPNPSIRKTEMAEFCIAGPQTTPHVAVQQLLQPGEDRSVTPALEPGRYRLRTLGLRGGEYLQVQPEGMDKITLRASNVDGWPASEAQIAPMADLHLRNTTDEEQLFILERLAWGDQTVTAAEVTALQVFRDLFATEALRPGQQISVGSLAIVFTDLRGSTRLYNQIGDAPAFGLVMNHFDVLREAVYEEGGAIIKTIGDAVMAVFPRPAPALRAMLKAQAGLEDTLGKHSAKLKAGIHYGPCIAVTLNERLDYFGSTVNMASRLEAFSSGDDVVISAQVYHDPEVLEWMEAGHFTMDPFEAQLKGFDDHFALWRVR
ncbi:MAG: adenylate/guanylate cyclase domain-containing protein [Anaerolineae bacterium]